VGSKTLVKLHQVQQEIGQLRKLLKRRQLYPQQQIAATERQQTSQEAATGNRAGALVQAA
jgi:hypothetical protein